MKAKPKPEVARCDEPNEFVSWERERVRRGDLSYRVFREDHRWLSGDEQHMICHLVNHAKSNLNLDGETWAAPSHTRVGTGIAEREQDVVLKSLERKGILTVTYRQARRMVRVDLAGLDYYLAHGERREERKPKLEKEPSLFG